MSPRHAWARQLAALAVFVAIWEAAGRAGLLNPLYAPSPGQIGAALGDLFGSGRIWTHLEATFTAALGGLALGIVAGIVLGVLGALIPLVAELLEPVMTLLNAIPRCRRVRRLEPRPRLPALVRPEHVQFRAHDGHRPADHVGRAGDLRLRGPAGEISAALELSPSGARRLRGRRST